MKINTLIFIVLILNISCLLVCCGTETERTTVKPTVIKDSYAGSSFRTMVVDSCEYIYLGYWFAHKGNCKYCKQRSLNNK
jgi:hypothetical protein